MTGPDEEMLDAALRLSWSLWAELGVSSWARGHRNWSVELEPLVAFTARLAGYEPRLLRESIDWCVVNEDLLSMHQLRHVVTARGWPFEGAIGRFGATVSERSKRAWPGSMGEVPYELVPAGSSRLRNLSEPALLQLRLRAMFGVSARAEILRVLVAAPSMERSVGQISSLVAYTRRQVSSDLEALTLGGLTRRIEQPGSVLYAVREPDALLRVIGARPEVMPRWAPLFGVLFGLLETSELLAARTLAMPATEVTRRLRLLQPALDGLRLEPPSPSGGGLDVESTLAWARGLFTSLAAADPSYLAAETFVV